MNNRLEHQQAQHLASDTGLGQTQKTRDFQEAEEVIRADREQTAVPERVTERLADSIGPAGGTSGAKAPWWRRLFR